MEPVFAGSWQCGQPATANDISPVSPVPSSAPASPTLYANQSKLGDELINELFYPNNELFSILENNINSPFVTSEGEAVLIASANTLNDIHRSFPSPAPASYQPPVDRTLNVSPALSADMNDYWPDEEPSMNLELFSGLVSARMSPVITEDVKPFAASVETPTTTTENHHNNELEQFVFQVSADFAAGQQSVLPAIKNDAEMDATFQDIVHSLNLNPIDVISNAEVIDVSELRDFGLSDLDGLSSHDSFMDEDEENSSISSVGSPSQDSSIGDGQELIVYTTDDSQSIVLENSVSLDGANMVFLSQPSSVTGSDLDDDAQEMVIDNLIRGDLQSASVLAGFSQTSGRFGATSTTRPSKSNSGHRVSAVPPYLKPERRGRKPSSANVEKSWVNLTDKVLRKKEQNKTAATRYRQKKKMEAMVTYQQEQELQQKHEELRKANQEVTMELSIIKKLLREVMDKPKKSSTARR